MEEAAKQLALLPFWTALSAAERDMAARAACAYDRGQPIYEGGSGCLGAGLRQFRAACARICCRRRAARSRCSAGARRRLRAVGVVRDPTDYDLHIAAERACELLLLPAKRLKGWKGSCEAVRSFVHADGRSALRDGGVGAVRAGSTGGWPGSCWPKAKKKRRARGAYDARGLARQLSSAREVVARTLKRFADAGLVELRRRRGAADRFARLPLAASS